MPPKGIFNLQWKLTQCARKAQERRKRCRRHILETFRRDPNGKIRMAKRAGGQNRVLGGRGVTFAAKRTQGACRPRH